jgi:8-oxo-dGTP pyrophosphatase MutT (NUDIX family)
VPRPIIDKAVAYITRYEKLLVFDHPGIPEAGTQVPVGTIEPGEPPDEAVLREAYEETGLAPLVMRRFLGEREFDIRPFGRDEIHHRHFYHLEFNGDAPDRWRHFEEQPSDGGEPVEFELYWADMPLEALELIAGQGDLLHMIAEVVS